MSFTWVQIKETEQHNRDSEATEDAKLRDEAFAKAVEKIANEHVEVRIGGIYGLGQLAHKSHDDYWPIMELLAAFAVNQSRRSATASVDDRADVQAAIRVLIWRDAMCDPNGAEALDLGGAQLVYYDLSAANLANADLKGANLEHAYLEGANLKGAHIGKRGDQTTNLKEADLQYADLRDVNFEGAYVSDANAYNANVAGVMPKDAREQLKALGAVELSEAAWITKKQTDGFASDMPRLFSEPAGCAVTKSHSE